MGDIGGGIQWIERRRLIEAAPCLRAARADHVSEGPKALHEEVVWRLLFRCRYAYLLTFTEVTLE